MGGSTLKEMRRGGKQATQLCDYEILRWRRGRGEEKKNSSLARCCRPIEWIGICNRRQLVCVARKKKVSRVKT